MCVARHRYGSLGASPFDFVMGPLPQKSPDERTASGILAGLDELTEEQKKAVQEFGEERQRQLDAQRPHGLRPPADGVPKAFGWQCPNCGGAHAPDVPSCPEPPKGGSLRERLKAARS